MITIRHLFIAAVIAHPAAALAQEAQVEESAEAESKFAVSAFIMPGAILPMAEVAGEVNLGSKMAVLASFGAGTADVDTRDMAGNFSSETELCLRASAQFRYYAFGNFDRGFFGGGDVGWFFVGREADNSVRTPNEGLWIGPAVGYKYTFDFGLLATLGVTVGFPITRPDGLTEEEAPGSDAHDKKAGAGLSKDVLFWPNLSVGWAF